MEPRKPARATVWLLPDLALALALFTVFYAFAFYRAPEQLFRDSDTGWHIRTGEGILRNLAVPRVDPYSFSRPGGEWYAWEWAADAAMGAAHRGAGLAGVAVLYLAAIGFCTWLWVRSRKPTRTRSSSIPAMSIGSTYQCSIPPTPASSF